MKKREPHAVNVDRVLPNSLEAEMGVLGSILLEPKAVAGDVINVIGTDLDHFYQHAHKVIYEAIVALFGRGDAIDPVILTQRLKDAEMLDEVGGPIYVTNLFTSVPTAHNWPFYLQILRDKYKLRRLIEFGTKIVSESYDPNAEPDKILSAYSEEIVRGLDTGYQFIPHKQALQLGVELLEQIYKSKDGLIGISTGFSRLDRYTKGMKPGDFWILGGPPSQGKALSLDTKLPSINGWLTMGDVKIGDVLFDKDGAPCNVMMVTDVMMNRKCYKISFSDNSHIVADGDHQWVVSTRNRRLKSRHDLVIRTTAQMSLNALVEKGTRSNYAIPACGPIQYTGSKLQLDPYVLGAWLGDGTSACGAITVGDKDTELLDILRRQGCESKPRGTRRGSNCMTYGLGECRRGHRVSSKLTELAVASIRSDLEVGITGSSLAKKHGVSKALIHAIKTKKIWDGNRPKKSVHALLRAVGVLANKHIPKAYLQASITDRIQLLRGLMDTDGSISELGVAEISVTNKELANNINELIIGLGYKTTTCEGRAIVDGRDCGPRYRIVFVPYGENVFALTRKRIRQRTGNKTARTSMRYITNIEPIESVPVKCIMVDSPSRTYLAGESCIPTHNTAIAMNILLQIAAQNIPVGMLSMETTARSLGLRALAAGASVEIYKFPYTADTFPKITTEHARQNSYPIFYDDRSGFTIGKACTTIRRMVHKHGVKVMAVDYLQLMDAEEKRSRDGATEVVSAVSRGMKNIAKELEITIFALSQLNRTSRNEKRRPELHDLKNSSQLEQDGDVVIMLQGEATAEDFTHYPVKPSEQELAELVLLNIPKNKDGKTGPLPFRWIKEWFKFIEWHPPQPATRVWQPDEKEDT